MIVKATKSGFYNNRRIREGMIFELRAKTGKKITLVRDERTKEQKEVIKEGHVFTPEEQFSSRWMVKVDPKKLKSAKKAELEAAAEQEEVLESDDVI